MYIVEKLMPNTNLQHGEQQDRELLVPGALACDLSVLSAEQRKRQATTVQQLHAAIQEVCALPTGYAFRFSPAAEMLYLLCDFLALERLCCPFIDFVLEVEAQLWSLLATYDGG